MAKYDDTIKYTLTQQGVVTLVTKILEKVTDKITSKISDTYDAEDRENAVSAFAVDSVLTALKNDVADTYLKVEDAESLGSTLGVVSQDDITSQITTAVDAAKEEINGSIETYNAIDDADIINLVENAFVDAENAASATAEA